MDSKKKFPRPNTYIYLALILFLFPIFYAFNLPKEKPYRILGIGSPCLDIFIPMQDKFLTKVAASKGGSSSLSQEEYRSLLEEKYGSCLKKVAGGSCLNTLKGLASLDQSCAILGRCGQDEAAKYILESFDTLGITSKLVVSTTPTAQVFCFITPDHERTMRCYLGASEEFSAVDLDPKLFDGVELVHIEGYTLYNGNVAKKAMQLAKSKGAKISFDLGSYQLVKQFKEEILELTKDYIDILFGNSEEFLALTDLPPAQACEKVGSYGGICVVLSGSKGCFVGNSDTVFHVTTRIAKAVDTTGAGDLFISGFLYGYIEGKSLQECASFGNLLGSTVIESFGAEIPKIKWEEIRKEIKNEAALTIN